MKKLSMTVRKAIDLGNQLGIDWAHVDFTPLDFKNGVLVETEEHGYDVETAIADKNDTAIFGMIAWRHLKESPYYYEHLEEMERVMKAELAGIRRPDSMRIRP